MVGAMDGFGGEDPGTESMSRGRRRRFAGSLALLCVLGGVALLAAPGASAFVYWANMGPPQRSPPDFGAASIGRANEDGSGVDQHFITGTDEPCGVAVDAAHIYWVPTAFYVLGTVSRANLDGGGVDGKFIDGTTTSCGVAVNSSHVFRIQTQPFSTGDTLGRAGLNGKGADDSFLPVAEGASGVAASDSHVYWASPGKGIGRATASGGGVDQGFIDTYATGVAIDASHIYWTGDHAIGRANLNGSAVDESFVELGPGSEPCGVAASASHIYWGDLSNDSIGHAAIDGSAVDPGLIPGADMPCGVAVDGAPGPPTIRRFRLGKAKINKRRGTAKLAVEVSGAGALALKKSKQLKGSHTRAKGAGTTKLAVRSRGKAKRKLRRAGSVRVKAAVTFRPDGGSPMKATKKLKLKQR